MTKPAVHAATTYRTPSASAKRVDVSITLRERILRCWPASYLAANLLLLCGCSPTLHPAITASVNSVNTMTIKGTGFTNIGTCAHLALLTPQSASIGDATCTSGTFNTDWSSRSGFNYVPGCQPTGLQSAVVGAVDITTLDPAFATTSILWGPNCAIVGTCGKIGQVPCPDPSYACYVDGGVDPSTGRCAPCGAEGQPLCSNSPACNPGLNPNLSGPGTVCTATCGGYNQSPCITNGTQPGVQVYTCYNTTLAYGDCVCVPNTQYNACQVESSGNSGICQTYSASPAGCSP